MTAWAPTRRALGTLLGSWAAGLALGRPGGAAPLDRGIGGTGAVPEPPSDRGIGGTGVVGTIRGFGSIVVNDQEIGYPDDARVTVDDVPAATTDLRLGHVVRVLAAPAGKGVATDRIAVVHEVVGRVQKVSRRALVVLGQTVVTPRAGHWRVGDRVAVSGLRRPDGVIVASLVEAGATAVDRVVGIPRRAGNGLVRLGRLRLSSLDADLLGQRVVLTGHVRRDRFVALSAGSELAELTALSAGTYSIESYVERSPGGVVIGNGYAASAEALSAPVPARVTVRAVLTASVGEGGRLVVHAVRVAGSPGGNHGLTGVGGRPPGGAAPPAARVGPGASRGSGKPGASGRSGRGGPGPGGHGGAGGGLR